MPNTETHEPGEYFCDCPRCTYDAMLDNYYERLAEAGSSAYMLYGNSSDAMCVAYQEVGPMPQPSDFGLADEPVRPAPIVSADPTDLPF